MEEDRRKQRPFARERCFSGPGIYVADLPRCRLRGYPQISVTSKKVMAKVTLTDRRTEGPPGNGAHPFNPTGSRVTRPCLT